MLRKDLGNQRRRDNQKIILISSRYGERAFTDGLITLCVSLHYIPPLPFDRCWLVGGSIQQEIVFRGENNKSELFGG